LAIDFDVQFDHFPLKTLKFRGPQTKLFEKLLKLVVHRFECELNQVDSSVQWFMQPVFSGETWQPGTVKNEILEKAYSEKTEKLYIFQSLKRVVFDFNKMQVSQNGVPEFELKRRDKNGENINLTINVIFS